MAVLTTYLDRLMVAMKNANLRSLSSDTGVSTYHLRRIRGGEGGDTPLKVIDKLLEHYEIEKLGG